MINDLEQEVKTLIKENITEKISALDVQKDFSAVEKCLTDIMAIAYNHNIEEAIDDIYSLQVQIGLMPVSKQQVRNRVNESYQLFPTEIKAFSTFVALQKGVSAEDEILAKVKSILKS